MALINCPECGKEVSDASVNCPNCGYPIRKQYANEEDRPSFGIALLGFLMPVIGLVLYLVWKGEKPLKAKSAGKGALIATILWIILYALALGLGLFLHSTNYY